MRALRFKRSLLARAFALLILYAIVLAVSHWLAFQLRFDFAVPAEEQAKMGHLFLWDVGLKLFCLAIFGQFSGLLSYFSIPDLKRVVLAVGVSSAILLWMRYDYSAVYNTPRGVMVVNSILDLSGLVALRLGFRISRERYFSSTAKHRARSKRVGIIGAGDVGASLAKELMAKRGLGLVPVAFFDDDRGKWQSRVHDVPVIGAPEQLLNSKLNLQLEEVIIAMPTATAKRVGEVIKLLHNSRLKFETVPSIDQLALGKVKVSQLRSVELEDLLGRQPVELETESIRQILQGKIVMVTGAGGSIGSELCRQIAGFNPQRLLLIEQCEGQMFQIEQELIEKGFGAMLLPLVADVMDENRMRFIFERFRPEVLFHAAAHKHVPLMESQPGEAARNNVLGTARVAELAMHCKVDRFIFVSTDKAINPTNVMGATKRMAEIFLQSLHASPANQTKFMAVRFGNVLGSSGSVIPTFKKQIAAGGPVKVTHPEVMRYFMTIPEAVGLVLQSAAQGAGGEIFVLDMGDPVKILDVARQLIELSGLRPDEDIEIEFIGLRPGEKLFEELSYAGENITKTNHPKIMRFVCDPLPLKEVRGMLDELTENLNKAEANQLKLILKKAVPEYQPYLM